MAEIPKNFNGVSFNAGGVEIALTLDADWVISAGERPNINVATIPAEEFNKLKPGLRTGAILFYFSNAPGGGASKADVELDGIAIVDIQHGRIGIVQTPTGNLPLGIIDYRVSFADVRHQLIPPRGGVLMLGDVNREPVVGPTPNGAPALTDTFDLIRACLGATGQEYQIGDALQNAALPPMRNLQWFGARAPVELSRLLQWVGGVLYANSDGSLGIDLLGGGATDLEIDADDLLYNVQVPAIDRRGKTVIFVSAPTAGQMVFDGTENNPDWYWVARDADGSWQKLDENSILDGLDVDDELANGWQDVPDQYVAQLEADVYRCLQLDPDTYNPLYNSLLKQVVDTQGLLSDIIVTGSVARCNPADGTWTNTDDTAQIQVIQLIGGQNVIRLAERVVTVSPSPTLDLLDNFEDVDPGDLTIKFNMEAANDDGKGYFACGFTRSGIGGAMVALTPDQVTSALGGGDDIVVLQSPAMRLIQKNGAKMSDGDNFAALQSQCEALAQTVLAGSDLTYQVIGARGFHPVELSGVISEVRYSQSQASTMIRQNSWFAPSTAFQVDPSIASKIASSRTLASGGSAGGEAHDNQSVTLPDRSAMGASGAHQPVHVVGDATPPSVMRFDCAVQFAGSNSETGIGFYDGYLAELPLDPNPSSNLQGQIQQASPQVPVLIMNLGEAASGLLPASAPAIVGVGTEMTLLGMRGPTLDSGQQLVWTFYDPTPVRSFQFILDPVGGVNMLLQASQLGTLSNPPRKTDKSWVTILTFKPCPS